MAEVSGFKKQLASSILDREREVSLAEAEYVRRPTREGFLSRIRRGHTRKY